uniref:Cryptide Pep-6 n=1 Tax=Tityus obscurus TaxID=1221240 RepID=CRY6_TITOB
WPNKIEPGK